MQRYKRWLGALCLCFPLVFAEEKQEAPVIVVTGNKVEQEAAEAVDKVSVVSGQQISEMGAKNAAEVLQNLPGVTVTEHPMEGVSMQGFSGAYVKVLIDGVAVGGEVGGASPIALIPASDIEHIEIIKGAASALYGSDAMGGVINIITKKNRSSWAISTKQEINLHKRYFGFLGFSHRNKLFGIAGSGSFDNTPGIITRETDPLGQRIDTFIFPKTRLGYGRLGADFYLPAGNMHVYGAYTNHLRRMNQAADIANLFSSEKGEGGLKTSLALSDALQFNLFSSYKYFQHFFDEIHTAYAADNVTRRDSTFHEVETEAVANYDFSFAHALLAGINVKWSMMSGIDFTKPKHFTLFGAFSQFVWNVRGEDRLRLVPGVRFDLAPPLGKGDALLWQITPKFSVRSDPLESLTLRFSYGMGFKTPTLKQKYWLFFHPAPTNFVLLGNPQLEPERSQGFNASLEYRPLAGLSFSTGGYFNFVNNLIFAVETDKRDGYYLDSSGTRHPVAGLRQYQNIDRVITTGGDASVSYAQKWVEASLSYTIAGMYNYDIERASYYEGAYFVPHQVKANVTGIIPPLFTRVTVSTHWDAPQRIREGFDSRAADRIKLNAEQKYAATPDKLLLNVHVSQQFWQERFEAYAGIKNLLDSRSFVNGSDGRTMKEYYGLTNGPVVYLGIGFKYNVKAARKAESKTRSMEEAESKPELPEGIPML